MNERYDELKSEIEDEYRACDDISNNADVLNDRVHVLEEEITLIKKENDELRMFVNTVVKELNNVISLLNARYNDDI